MKYIYLFINNVYFIFLCRKLKKLQSPQNSKS